MNGKAFDWRLGVGMLLAGAAVAAAAFAMPVHPPETGAGSDPAAAVPKGVAEAAPEDLAAFLEIRRWGAPPPAPEPESAPAEEPHPALNPVLAEMGFVGLIAVQEERAVLLALPEGDIVRMLPGDTLPDGRILVSVADNSLTLKEEGGGVEVLTLFPPVPGEAAPLAGAALPGAGREPGGDAAISAALAAASPASQ